MRLIELLENYADNLVSDMENVLIQAKARGIYEIPTKQIVNTLVGMGYSVDVDSIIGALQTSPMVQHATKQETMLNSSDAVLGAEQSHNPGNDGKNHNAGDDTGSKVSDMAQSALDLS